MPINIPTNTIGSKIWDIVRVTKFKTKSKRMALLLQNKMRIILNEFYVSERLIEFKKIVVML